MTAQPHTATTVDEVTSGRQARRVSAPCEPTLGETTTGWWPRPERSSPTVGPMRRSSPSPSTLVSGIGTLIAISRRGSTSSRPCTGPTSTSSPSRRAARRRARSLGRRRRWLQAFVRYAQTKRTLLSELHEAFEKNPQLKSVSRDRIEGALSTVLEPGPAGRRRSHRHRRVRPDAAAQLDVHERHRDGRRRATTARHDPGRPPPPGVISRLTPGSVPRRETRPYALHFRAGASINRGGDPPELRT